MAPDNHQPAGHGQKFTRNMEKAIASLLVNPSIPDAAKEVGIGERTLWRWFKIPEFEKAYRLARREVVRHAVVNVQAAMSEAVETLRSIMNDGSAPASARVSAARAVIDTGLKAVELEDLDHRLSAIEEIIKTGR